MNYFKVCGDGFGKAIHCFPFTTGAEAWKFSFAHPDLKIVGVNPVEDAAAASDKPSALECETEDELDRHYPKKGQS